MNSQDIRNLQEAYMEVVMNEENTTSQKLADRAKKLSNQRKGQTTQSRSTYKNLSQQASQRANPKEEPRGHRFTPGRKESGLTQKDRDELRGDDTLYYGKGSLPKNPRKRQQKVASGKHIPEQTDLYDIILSHLLDEGYAETPEAAEAIMVNMGEEWREDIVEAKVDKKLPEYKRSGARLDRYDNPSGALALGGGQQRARRAEHEERRNKKK